MTGGPPLRYATDWRRWDRKPRSRIVLWRPACALFAAFQNALERCVGLIFNAIFGA